MAAKAAAEGSGSKSAAHPTVPLAGFKRKASTDLEHDPRHEAALRRAARRTQLVRASAVGVVARQKRRAARAEEGGKVARGSAVDDDAPLHELVEGDTEMVMEDLGPHRRRGMAITEEESQQVLLTVTAAMHAGLSLSNALDVVHQSLGLSPGAVHTIYRLFDYDEDLYASPPGKRGKKASTAFGKRKELLKMLSNLIAARVKVGRTTTTRDVQRIMKEKYGTIPSIYFVRSLLHSAKMEYGNIGIDWVHYSSSQNRPSQIRKWLFLRDWAAKEEAAGHAVIVYTDESYVDVDAHRRKGWHRRGATFGTFPKGTGKRIVLLHAFTKDGVLTTFDAEGKPAAPAIYENEAGETLFGDTRYNCLGMFVLDAKADYHVTSQIFMRYLNNVLLPTARARYPGKRIIIMLDNASSHQGRSGPGAYIPGTTKASTLAALKAAGCHTLLVPQAHAAPPRVLDLDDPAQVAEAGRPSGRANPHRPTLVQLRALAHQWIRDNRPTMLLTDQQRWALDNDVFLLFTVPYMPDTQPIELVWGTIKTDLRRQYTTRHKGFLGTMIDKIERTFSSCHLLPPVLLGGEMAAGTSLPARYVQHSLNWANRHLTKSIEELRHKGKLGTWKLTTEEAKQVASWTAAGSLETYVAANVSEEVDVAAADDLPISRGT